MSFDAHNHNETLALDSDTDDDEALSQAIALSLQNTDQQQNHPHQYDRQFDRHEQEQEDMKLALALSLGKTVDQLTARDFLNMESMESTLLSNTDDQRKRPQSPDNTTSGSLKKIKSTTVMASTGSKYWDGTIKLTHIRGFFGPSFIRFEDIVQKTQLKKALVTAFVWTKDFIDEHFPKEVNMCIVSHGRPPSRVQLGPNRLLITPPLKDDRFGCFHIKLMLLFHQDSLRVVIGSANLEPYDYNDLENVVFIQDFPHLRKTNSSTSDDNGNAPYLPSFAKDICDLLDEMYVPESVKDELKNYDFTKAKAHIVASVSGVFEGEENYRKYGHTRLADIITEMGAKDPSKKPKVEMQTSSLGALSKSYLQELYASFCGIHPHADGNAPKKKATDPLPPVDIIYPTFDTVTSSRLGAPGAGTICLNKKTWLKPTFPKEIMCDTVSYRPGTLMHSKYIIATLLDKETNDIKSSTSANTSITVDKQNKEILGWMYCGSHNATASAWGRLTLSKSTKQPKMIISNWELGVVLPITEESDFPTPYQRPAPRYRPGQQAWTQDMDY